MYKFTRAEVSDLAAIRSQARASCRCQLARQGSDFLERAFVPPARVLTVPVAGDSDLRERGVVLVRPGQFRIL